jgi:hypothetical protein
MENSSQKKPCKKRLRVREKNIPKALNWPEYFLQTVELHFLKRK